FGGMTAWRRQVYPGERHVVGDLDGDGVSDVLTRGRGTYMDSSFDLYSGRSGSRLWALEERKILHTSGDLDGDGKAELLTLSGDDTEAVVTAWDGPTGRVRWRTKVFESRESVLAAAELVVVNWVPGKEADVILAIQSQIV